MFKIYFITDGFWRYIGSTKRSPEIRLREHRSKKHYPFDWSNTTVLLIETCSVERRFEVENKWIRRYSAHNKALASQGPIGHARSQKARGAARKMMRGRWAKNRAKMLAAVNSHKTFDFQSKAGKLGGKAKAAKGRVTL